VSINGGISCPIAVPIGLAGTPLVPTNNQLKRNKGPLTHSNSHSSRGSRLEIKPSLGELRAEDLEDGLSDTSKDLTESINGLPNCVGGENETYLGDDQQSICTLLRNALGGARVSDPRSQ
jgi:hypothetical protein